jgi:hypothetical protein
VLQGRVVVAEEVEEVVAVAAALAPVA